MPPGGMLGSEVTMLLYSERVEIILQQIQLKSVVRIVDLTEQLQVSIDTVRRDLKSMERNGLIKCVRGGACLPDSLSALSDFSGSEITHIDLKREAARKAVRYIEPNLVIAMNSGTTNTILAQELAFRNDKITVVTNNLAAANILMQNSFIRLIVVGGMVDVLEKSTYGTVCEKEFSRYYPDIAFLSMEAVNDREGFTDFRLRETGIIEILADRSGKTLAVMDSSKLGKRSQKKVLSLDRVDRMLTDDSVSIKLKKEYEQKGLLIE